MAKTVLVADDDEINRELVCELLKRGGYRVLPAEDGQAAWRALQEGKADMAVLDLNMPHMDGLEVTRRIRGDERLKDMPVILLTIRSLVADQISGYDRGADDYLTKPFDSRMLLARLRALERRVLGRRGGRK